jgi:hypothetical protein
MNSMSSEMQQLCIQNECMSGCGHAKSIPLSSAMLFLYIMPRAW